MRRQTNLLIIATAATLLVGCAPAPKPLYTWGHYQPTIYAYYQKDRGTVQEQIASLKQTLETARSENRPVPPGFHAHLGLLYASLGNGDLARQEFTTEKTLFPESEQYMDFLLSSKEQNK